MQCIEKATWQLYLTVKPIVTLIHYLNLQNIRRKYFTVSFFENLFENGHHNIIDFMIKETHLCFNSSLCY